MSGNKDHGGDRAATLVPPPLVYVPFVLLAKLLEKTFPLPVLPKWLATGLAVTTGGLAIAGLIWSMVSFRRHKTPVEYNRPANQLMTTGPFQYSRNPVYVCFMLLVLAYGCRFNNLWLVLMIVPCAVAVYWLVIRHEEAYLQRNFGEVYQAYKNRVRRWL